MHHPDGMIFQAERAPRQRERTPVAAIGASPRQPIRRTAWREGEWQSPAPAPGYARHVGAHGTAVALEDYAKDLRSRLRVDTKGAGVLNCERLLLRSRRLRQEVVGLAASGKCATRAVGGMEAVPRPSNRFGSGRLAVGARCLVGGVRQPTVLDGCYRRPEGAAASTDADCAQAIVRPAEDCRRLKQCLMTPGTHGIFHC